ncbi:MAG: hypothetical protein IJR67_00600 [Acholeplasmatales bacterium]|nr:hypothetical protein [Acholeplasmatales bacterium]
MLGISNIFLENYLEAYTATIELANSLIGAMLQKKERHNKEEEILKQIIYNQRCLKYVCKGDYDKEYYMDYERKIDDFLQTYFGDDFSLSFTKNNTSVFWAIRLGQEIDGYVIEESLREFIELCNKKKYKVQ